MPADASAQLRAIAAKCKETGDRGLMNGVRREIRVAAQPLIADLHQQALARLPKRGGLNQQVAGQRITVSTLAGARTAGVRLRTTAPDTQQTDEGFVRHPSPRNNRGKGKWRVTQTPAAKGWWTDTLANSGHVITPAIVALIARTNAQIEAL